MVTMNQEDNEAVSPQQSATARIGWGQIFAISILAFAFNFHWAALGVIVIPSQVLEMVGDLHKGTALALVVVPGAFVALFSNPLFGWLSDRTGGRLAVWGRRRPYIFIGIVVNIAGLLWMASARNVATLAAAYIITQFFSNMAQAPFHALLPDIVPVKQRGVTSGLMGLLLIAGNVGGLLVAAIFINTNQSLALYLRGQWIVYLIIIAVMFVLMLITIFSVRDRAPLAEQPQVLVEASEEQAREELPRETPSDAMMHSQQKPRRNWISPSATVTIVGTLVVVALAWGLMAFWNMANIAGIQIDTSVQEVVLEIIATIGILRLFDFRPRRDPDFAWVIATRLILMLGIYMIQTFLEYYMKDAVGAANPSQAATTFGIIVSLTGLVTAFVAGWLSDHFGRKRMVYIAGFMMAVVGLVFVFTHSLPLVLASGALFGLGNGAYSSVDWALVVDVLPSNKNFARDMGVWNIAVSLAQVVAPVVGGPIIDSFTQAGHPVEGFQVLFSMAIVCCVLGTVTIRFIKGVKK